MANVDDDGRAAGLLLRADEITGADRPRNKPQHAKTQVGQRVGDILDEILLRQHVGDIGPYYAGPRPFPHRWAGQGLVLQLVGNRRAVQGQIAQRLGEMPGALQQILNILPGDDAIPPAYGDLAEAGMSEAPSEAP